MKKIAFILSVLLLSVKMLTAQCPNLLPNGNFDSGTSPACDPNNPGNFATFSIALATGWNNATFSNCSLAPSADYLSTNSGNIQCLNVTPAPNSGCCHGGIENGGGAANNYMYKEFIVSPQSSPLVSGRTYAITYYYKRFAGLPLQMGVWVSTSFSMAQSVTGQLLTPQFEFPQPNQYVKAVTYYTASSNSGIWLTLGATSSGPFSPSGHYYFFDDVSIVESVAISAPGGTSICAGSGTLSFVASGAASYIWSVSPTATITPSGANCTFTAPTTAGNYTLTVTGTTPSGCSSSASIVIQVNSSVNPTLSILNGTNPTCANNPITLIVYPNYNTVQWYNSSGPISGATSYTYVPPASGTYYVIMTIPSSGCAYTSNLIQVTINPTPVVNPVSISEHCALANDGTINANASSGTAPYSYVWTTSPVQTSSTATGLDAGTYSVTVTDANGCTGTGSATVGTTADVAVPVITTNALNNNLCSSNTITYTVSNFVSGYTYVPSYSVTPLSVSNPLTNMWTVTWPSSCNDVVFTLMAYNVNPVCTANSSVTVFACCTCTPSTGDVVMTGDAAHDEVNELPASVLTNSFGNYTYSNPNGILYINGTFNIPSYVNSFTFSPGSEVRFGANAKIQMTGTQACTFNINQSHFAAGCNDMWDGIYFSGTNKTVNVLGSATQVSLIEDAQNGLVSYAGANFTLDNAVFNKNYISVQAINYPANHPGTIHNSVFTCRRLTFTNLAMLALRGISPPTVACQQFALPVANNATATLLYPYAGKRSYAGVYLERVGTTTEDPATHQITSWTNITVGTGNTSNFSQLNIFDNLDYGVYALNSNVIVHNNQFQNLSGPTAVTKTTPNYGIGVYGTNNTLVVSRKIIVGDNLSRNSFYDCNRGVDLNGYYDASVVGNCFQSNIVYSPGSLTQSPVGNFAAFVKSGRYINTEINNNHIVNWNFGIAFFSEYLPVGSSYTRTQGDLNIKYNDIRPVVSGLPTTQFVGTAITAQSLSINCGSCNPTQNIYGHPRIEQNVNIVDVFNGIDVQGWSEGTIVADNVITVRYQPNLGSTVFTQAGIRSISSLGVNIYRNDISGNTATGNTTAKLVLRGINAVNNTNVKVRCNTMNNVGQCMTFDGLNNGPVVNNNMYNCTDGLVLTNNGIIGQQGSSAGSGQVCDNRWYGPFANSQTLVDLTSSANNSHLYVRATPSYYNPSINLGTGIVYSPTTIHALSGGASFDCSSAPAMIVQDSDEKEPQVKLMEEVVQDSLALGGFADEASWMNKHAVYAMLQQDSTLMDTSVVLQQFYAQTPSTNIGKVTNTGVLLAQTDTVNALSVNQTINPELQPEQSFKDVDNIYIALISGNPADSIQMQTLEEIAAQCPQQGGIAVYRARALLNVLNDNIRYWDDNCASSARIIAPQQTPANNLPAQDIYLLPNPNDGNMTLSYILPEDQQGQFVIYDVLGNTIAQTTLENGVQQKQIDLTRLPAGIYYYKVTFNNSTIKNDKIIIVK